MDDRFDGLTRRLDRMDERDRSLQLRLNAVLHFDMILSISCPYNSQLYSPHIIIGQPCTTPTLITWTRRLKPCTIRTFNLWMDSRPILRNFRKCQFFSLPSAIFSILMIHSRSGDKNCFRSFWPPYQRQPSCQEVSTETLSRSCDSVVILVWGAREAVGSAVLLEGGYARLWLRGRSPSCSGHIIESKARFPIMLLKWHSWFLLP